MNNLLKKRLAVTMEKPETKGFISPSKPGIPAVPPDEIRKIVLDFLGMTENIESNHADSQPVPGELAITFKGIEHFSDWYTQRLEAFTEQQRIALGSVLQARQGINAGCSCRRNQRLRMAEDYYSHFFTQNASTDIIATIKNISGANTINFFKDGTLFLKI